MPDLFWDVETRSAASLRLVGAWNYGAHPTTEVLCLCYAVDDGEVQTWINRSLLDPNDPGDPVPEPFLAAAFRHDVPAAPILGLDDLPLDEQVVHNEVFVEREHPQAGRMREPRPAPRFSATPAAVGRTAPVMGEHSDEIVAELGHDPGVLRAAGVIG